MTWSSQPIAEEAFKFLLQDWVVRPWTKSRKLTFPSFCRRNLCFLLAGRFCVACDFSLFQYRHVVKINKKPTLCVSTIQNSRYTFWLVSMNSFILLKLIAPVICSIRPSERFVPMKWFSLLISLTGSCKKKREVISFLTLNKHAKNSLKSPKLFQSESCCSPSESSQSSPGVTSDLTWLLRNLAPYR